MNIDYPAGGCGFFHFFLSRYGKVFTSHLWGSPAVVSTDPEVSRAVLQADASAFVPWYPRSLMELMGESSILVLGGALQRRVHGLAGAFFKSPQLRERLTADMQGRVGAAMNHGWTAGVPVRVQDEAKSVRTRHDEQYSFAYN
jgi:hypothetical protein